MHKLSPPKGSTKNSKRVGRGPGSGRGKTSRRGHKGQLSRSGGGKGPGFEGGQMPLQRRVPKRGFTNIHRKTWEIVNLRDLDRIQESEIGPELLRSLGIVKGNFFGIKVLSVGSLERALHIKAHAFSKTARQKIEAAGGKAEVVSL